MCTVPTGGGKDSVCTVPTGEGKDSVCTVPSRGGENSVYTGYTQSSSVQQCTRKVTKSASGGQTEAVSSGMGKTRLPLVNYRAHKRRIQVALQRTPKLIQGTLHSQQLRRLRQTKCLMDLYSRPAAERRNQSRSYPRQSAILQPSLPGPKTRQPLEASHRFKCTKQIPGHPKIQDGDPRVHPRLPQKRGVGHIYKPHRHLPTCTYSHPVSEIPQVSFPRRHLQFTSLPFGLATAPLIFTSIVKEVKLIALQSGIRLHQYLDDWLIRAPSKQTCMDQTQKLLKLVKDLGFIVNLKKSDLTPSQRFDFLGYHFLLDLALVKPTQDRWTKLQMFHRLSLKSVISARTLMSTIGLLASTEKTAYETFSVASQNSLEISDASGHTDPLESENDTKRGMVVRPSKCATRRISPPQGTRKTYLYRRLKRRLGRSLRSKFYRRSLVSHREASSHQLIRTEGGSSGSAFLPNRLQKQSSPYRLRQHLGGGLHQQTGRHKISRTLCSNVENPHLVSPKQCHTQSQTRTGFTQCNSGRPLKEEPDPTNRVVPISTDLQTNFQTLEESPSGPVHNQPEQKTSYICLSDSGSSGLGSRCPQHPMGKPGCLRFSSHRPTAQGCTKTSISNVQDDSDCPGWLTKPWFWGLVELSLDIPRQLPPIHTLLKQPLNNHYHANPTSLNLHVWYLGVQHSKNMVSLQKWQKELLLLRDSPQDPSTLPTVFQRWCTDKQVDFRNPSIGDICNFFGICSMT